MADIKSRVQKLESDVESRNLNELISKTDNIYEALAIIGTRANQLSNEIKTELHSKLEEFAATTETLEEINENKEQIEISKFYERLPNPALIATNEFVEGQLDWRFREDENA